MDPKPREKGEKMSDHFNLMMYFTTNSKHCVDITYATSENKKARMTRLKITFLKFVLTIFCQSLHRKEEHKKETDILDIP